MISAAALLRYMPEGYEDACFKTGAIVRKRDIKDPNDLMMLALFHLLTGCSLVEISEISRLAKLGDISDVAFMKRFKGCSNWFKWISNELRQSSGSIISYDLPECLKNYRIIAVDASDVAEKGRSGRIFRLHFGLDIMHMSAALFSITDNSVGEHLKNFNLCENDLVLADRAYANSPGIEHCRACGAQYIARMRSGCFNTYNADGTLIDLLSEAEGKECGSIHAFIKKDARHDKKALIPVRICFIRKSEESIASGVKKMKLTARRKGKKITDKAFRFNEYIFVATSLDDKIPARAILDLYRYRWQVELYFKRLKSIIGYGELPKKSEESIYSWLNGKLMVALLIEKMIGSADFSPFEEELPEHLEGNQDG